MLLVDFGQERGALRSGLVRRRRTVDPRRVVRLHGLFRFHTSTLVSTICSLTSVEVSALARRAARRASTAASIASSFECKVI